VSRLLGLAVFAAAAVGGASIHAAGEDQPTAVLSLADKDGVRDLAIRASVDGLTFQDAWMRSIDAIFEFADVDSNGTLDENESRLIPSARSVQMAIGAGFATPIQPIRSLRTDVLAGEDDACDRAALRRYYQRRGVGCLRIGHGPLPHTPALTRALTLSLDQDADGCLSEQEFRAAEATLKRLDANDDDLVGAGELAPGATYPGKAADFTLLPSGSVDLSVAQDGSLVLRRLAEDGKRPSSAGALPPWEISASATTFMTFMGNGGSFRCEAWAVRGRLPEQLAGLTETFGDRDTEPMMAEGEGARASGWAWLTVVADRNGDGAVSSEEVEAWLRLQRQIAAGHVLVSIHSGGGLFEVLDRNHDAALSVRELREAWGVIKAAGCVSDDRIDPTRVPNQVLIVVSHGYPVGLARDAAAPAPWFLHMDRNGDGDVARREFTASPDIFAKLDADRDGLLSASEAATAVSSPAPDR